MYVLKSVLDNKPSSKGTSYYNLRRGECTCVYRGCRFGLSRQSAQLLRLSSGEHFNSFVHSIDTSCSAFVLKNVKFTCKERWLASTLVNYDERPFFTGKMFLVFQVEVVTCKLQIG